MNTFYIANYCTIETLRDAHDEEPSFEQLASPQFSDATTTLSDEWLAALREKAEAEYLVGHHYDECVDPTNRVQFYDLVDQEEVEITWEVSPTHLSPIVMVGKCGDEVQIMVVVQRVDLP